MKWKYWILPSVVACITAISLGTSAFIWRAHTAAAAQVAVRARPWTPYTINYKTHSKQPEWTQPVLLGESMEAVRSDGGSVEYFVTYKLDRSIHGEQLVLSLPGGIRIVSKERLGLMTATRDGMEDAARARQRFEPLQSCAMTVEGGQMNPTPVVTRDMLLGYETFKIVSDMKILRTTLWRSAALDCAELRMVTEKIDEKTGQFYQASDRIAVEIRPGEPDPALFELPKGLRNVAPSELAIAAKHACCNANLKDNELAALRQSDEHFQQFRYDW